jgi:hypothetical protein
VAQDWNPLDQTPFFSMEKFESEQFAVTEPLLHDLLQSLIAAQVVIVNTVHAAMDEPQTGDANTPVFGLAYRVVDAFRVSQHMLLLGYIVQATQVARDALESAALCLLLAKHPERTESYYAGEQFWPGQVRAALAEAGDIDTDVLAGVKRTYAFLSKVAHPNIEGLAYTIDEVDHGGGNIERTFRAGGTREPKRLMMFATMTIGTAMTAAVLVIDALAPLVRESRRPKLYAARAFVMGMARKPFAAAVEKQEQQTNDAE